jgi:uncharacterized protein YndB with AHSA1/START domain
MIRGLLRLSLLGAGVAWVGERVMSGRAPGPVRPIPMMIVIDAPIERVWAFVSDIEGQPRWMHDMKTVRMLTPGPTRVGSRGEATVRMFGVSSADPVTVTAFDPPTTFAVSHEGSFAGSGVFRLEPGADGTTTIVHWDETLAAPVLPHLAAVVTTPVFRHVFERDLERLRDLIEGSP